MHHPFRLCRISVVMLLCSKFLLESLANYGMRPLVRLMHVSPKHFHSFVTDSNFIDYDISEIYKLVGVFETVPMSLCPGNIALCWQPCAVGETVK